MKTDKFPVAQTYLPVKRRATLAPARADVLAASMLKAGRQAPIKMRGEERRPGLGGPLSTSSDALTPTSARRAARCG